MNNYFKVKYLAEFLKGCNPEAIVLLPYDDDGLFTTVSEVESLIVALDEEEKIKLNEEGDFLLTSYDEIEEHQENKNPDFEHYTNCLVFWP